MSYKDLKSYQQATVIYDLTVEFCDLYIDKSDRTNRTYHSRMWEQMVHAARSGKQNIVEGSAQRTSEKSELKLLGVARASLQELLEDYEDFLRQNGFRKWNKNEPAALEVRNLYRTNKTYKSYFKNPETAANAAICLINQANFLLDRQIESLEKAFVEKGGYTENLYQRRLQERQRQSRIRPISPIRLIGPI